MVMSVGVLPLMLHRSRMECKTKTIDEGMAQIKEENSSDLDVPHSIAMALLI